ncbi:MAG TPA: excinuclease ABC subunit UvrC [Spirochaetota bacterium]|nr:excinuclease ABC subunit UvrC [Spirochaetota bacterium]HOM37967.1 excinuclease ABC subunit UvrC [Spirochaetota bacterium]HPQ48772.1 excinuclease ABC subunit UvrC [Spirochaetota bacterium]
MAFKIKKEFIKNLPTEPGVYLFSKENTIIYVGKAKNLKKRISSYFSKKHNDLKTQLLSQNIDKIDFIITTSEVDALILEDKLIKKHKPKFNIQLKDNKTYPYIAIDYNTLFPRIYKTRENHKKGVIYYGPFTEINILNNLLKIGIDFFGLRSCKTKIKKDKPKKVCLYYHIKKCPGYCTLKIDENEYISNLENFKKLITGNRKALLTELHEKMLKYANNLEFEKAAKIRDTILFIEKIKSSSIIYFKLKKDIDVIGTFTEDKKEYFISILSFRDGVATSKKSIKVKNNLLAEEEMISQVISRYYIENQTPSIILTRIKVNKDIKEYLSKYWGKKVKIITPKKTLKILDIADKNAKHEYILENMQIRNYNLKELLKLSKEPETIECFDIATIEGKWSVGSSVRFYNYKPDKSNYRAYKIGDFEVPNDYEMIQILLLKRIGSKRELPDMIIIDGGKGQLSSALEILNFFFINIDVIAIAKKEEIIYTKNGEEIVLEKTSKILKLITKIRDESHRFANILHDKIRTKRLKTTNLEKIKGIGKKRISLLLGKYGSIENMLKNSPQKISEETGIPLKIAEKIVENIKIKNFLS